MIENRGPTLMTVMIIFSSLSTVFVAGRLFSKAMILKIIHFEDYLIILSMICGYVNLGYSIAGIYAGNGRHFDTLNLKQKQDVILYTTVSFTPGIMSFAVPKIAVVALLTRIMNPNRAHRLFLWSMVIFCWLVLLACVAILFAQCTPARALWDFSVQRQCFPKRVLVDYAIFAGSQSAFVDLYLATYPAIVLFRLKLMCWKKKLALSCALGLGSLAAIVAIYKTTRIPSLGKADFSYETSDLIMWTCIEGSTIIMAACIPTLQPLMDFILGKRSLSKGRYHYSHHGPQQNSRATNIKMSNRNRLGSDKWDNGEDPGSFGSANHNDSQQEILQ